MLVAAGAGSSRRSACTCLLTAEGVPWRRPRAQARAGEDGRNKIRLVPLKRTITEHGVDSPEGRRSLIQPQHLHTSLFTWRMNRGLVLNTKRFRRRQASLGCPSRQTTRRNGYRNIHTLMRLGPPLPPAVLFGCGGRYRRGQTPLASMFSLRGRGCSTS